MRVGLGLGCAACSVCPSSGQCHTVSDSSALEVGLRVRNPPVLFFKAVLVPLALCFSLGPLECARWFLDKEGCRDSG